MIAPFEWRPGDKVRTPTGRIGTVQQPPWLMPKHQLVEFEGGTKIWILTELLELVERPPNVTPTGQLELPLAS